MEKDIKAIVLLTHGEWGSEMLKSAQMILGNIKDCFAIPLYDSQSIDSFKSQILEIIRLYDNKVLFITDILGGTPTNIIVQLSFQYDIYVINGLSLELFIIAYNLRRTCPWENLVESIVHEAEGICYDVKRKCEKILEKMNDN